MSAELDALWQLKELDERVTAARTALARYPELKRSLEQRVTEERARVEAHRKALADLQKNRRELERRIEELTAQERKFLSQQGAVKTNAEYQALTHEIEGVRRQRSDVETQVLEAFEQEERLAAEKTPVEAALRTAEDERARRLAGIESEEAAEQSALAALDAERAVRLEGLAPAVRARYERVHGSLEGKAVVAIVKNACGGCFRTQPPHVVQEARKRDRLLTCEGCGRILVLPPDGAA
jgi:predicted  nucleic acid-binding Zn-ribbon protein